LIERDAHSFPSYTAIFAKQAAGFGQKIVAILYPKVIMVKLIEYCLAEKETCSSLDMNK